MMAHTLRAVPAAGGVFLPTSLHEFGHGHPEPLRQPAQHAQGGVMATELDPRQIAAAYVGFLGEGFLAQTTGCPQLPEPLHEGVHVRPQCYLSCTAGQPDNRGRPSPNLANPRSLDTGRRLSAESLTESTGRRLALGRLRVAFRARGETTWSRPPR